MSLINDALKRVEKSLNDNSSTQQSRKVPPFTIESSGRSKKLFFITLIGGTLFFSILILLLLLIFSDTILPSSQQATLIATSNTPNVVENLETYPQQPVSTQQPPAPLDTKTNEPNLNNYINENTNQPPMESTIQNTEHSIATSDESEDNSADVKNLNQEFFESIVNLASKAFISNSTANINKTSPAKAALPQQSQKENLTLSTAQETLNMIEQESQQLKSFPENKIQKFVDSLSITGVMISKDQSMVLINNRVYSINDIINSNFNLKLIEIYPQKIVLQDATGSIYTVDF